MGKKIVRKRRLRPRAKIREIARPNGYEGFAYAVWLLPEYLYPDSGKAEHDGITAVVRAWGNARVLSRKRGRFERRTRIYFRDETGLVMFRAAFPNNVWKIYRLVDAENKLS